MAALSLSILALLSLDALLVEASPKVVPMRTYRTERRGLAKRDPLSVNLGNAIANGLYFVNASIGTPPQEVQLQVDTGSSDLWMFGPKSCDSTTSPCLGGAFDPSQSSSYTLLEEGTFSITYVTAGSGIKGDYASDNVALGGTTIQNLTIAIASSAKNVPTGIMGIGFNTDESIVSQGGQPYPNIIDVMVSEGLIKTRAYSLYLDDLTDATGTVLFGGYDTEKYSGDLTVLQIFPDAQSGTISSMTVAWTSLSLTDSSGTNAVTSDTSAFPLPAILDSGTTHTIVPADMYSQLSDYFQVISDDTYGALVACNISDVEGSLDFGFGGDGGATISISFAELAIPLFDQDGNQLTFEDGSLVCAFGLEPTTEGEPILFGDTFLRSAYVVYDLDNQQIGIAPTKFESTSSNIVEIGSSGNVGGVSSVADGVTVVQTATADVPLTFVASQDATATRIQTTIPTGHIGGISAGATKPASTGTVSSPTASHTKNAAPATLSPFDTTRTLVVGSSFVMMLFGALLVVN